VEKGKTQGVANRARVKSGPSSAATASQAVSERLRVEPKSMMLMRTAKSNCLSTT
jgi:hypothetical protein